VAGPRPFQVLRRKAIEQNKRLVVLFASQSVLEAIAMTIGADLSGKVRRETGCNMLQHQIVSRCIQCKDEKDPKIGT